MQGLDASTPDFAQRLGERIASSLQPSLAMVQSLLQVGLRALRLMPDPLLFCLDMHNSPRHMHCQRDVCGAAVVS